MSNETESYCEKARRLAHEENTRRVDATTAKRVEFFQKLEINPLPAQNDDGSYTVCGYRFSYYAGDYAPMLMPSEFYKGHSVSHHYIYNILDLGQALLELDADLPFLKAKYPDTWWGNFRAWWDRTSFFL